MKDRANVSPVAYVALTFIVTWSFWYAAGAVAGVTLGAGVIGILLLYLGTFTPAFVAIALTARAEGTRGVAALLRPLVQWNVGGRWYAFAAGYLMVIKLTAALVHRVLIGEWPVFGVEPVLLMIGSTVLSLIVFGQAGEEVGWRGFALPRLAERMGYARAAILVGVIWAAWHLPLFFIAGVSRPGYSVLLFTVQVMALSVGVTWLYVRTGGSLWLTMLMHAAINNTGGIVRTTATAAADPWTLSAPPMVWIYAVVLWIPAGWFLMHFRTRAESPLRRVN